MKSERLLTIMMVVSMCIWGISWSSAKVLSEYSTPFNMAFIRVFTTFITYIPIILITKQSFKVRSKGIYYVIGSGLMLTCYGFLFFKGLSIGQSGKGGVMVTIMSPVFAYSIVSLIKKKLPTANEFIGLGLGILAGIILMRLWDTETAVSGSATILFIFAAFTWAMMGVFTSFSKPYAGIIPFTMWMHVITLIGLSFFIDGQALINLLKTGDLTFWLNALYLGILNSAVATTVFLYASSQIGADKAGSFMFIVPCVAMFTSWIIFDEALETHTLAGGIIGILAVLTINGKFKRKQAN